MQLPTVELSRNLVEAGQAISQGEQRRMARRLTTMLLGLGMLGVGLLYGLVFPGQRQVGALLQSIAALLVSTPVFLVAIKGFLSRPSSAFTEQLVGLAILAAMSTGDFITATLVPLFLDLGHIFEERSVAGARAAIDGILKLGARSATLLDGDHERVVSPENLSKDDIVLVRPGEVIPADGRVLEGRSSVDQAPVTGESLHEDVAAGDGVFAGTVNLTGVLRISVTGVGSDTAIGRVVRLLKSAEAAHPPFARLLERYSSYYLPMVVTIAAIVLFLTADINRAIAILVVSCPCALVLSVPTAMVASLAVAARMGVLIKSSRFLETMSEIDTVVLDKTGTVTLGAPAVVAVRPEQGLGVRELFSAAVACANGSLHPFSRAVVQEARARGFIVPAVSDVMEIPGLGVEARTDDGLIRLGRASWLKDLGIAPAPGADNNRSTVWIARDDRILGSMLVKDRPRKESRKVLERLRSMGVQRILLLTGDREPVARVIANDLGFDGWVAEVVPEQKLDVIRQEQVQNHKTMMVGDGVNDALALSGADVGVAMGARVNEVALGGADIALMTDNLWRLPQTMLLSSATKRTITANVVIGVSFSVFMLILASAGIISPLWGAALHNGGSVFVLMNSARLMRFQPECPNSFDT